MTIQALVDFAASRGGLATDDLLASLLPLFRQVAACHETGVVAPLRGIDALEADDQLRVSFDPSLAGVPAREDAAISAVERRRPSAVEIVGQSAVDEDAAAGPAFAPGWETWEHRLGHHDELTDIASLGQLLVALAAGLDLGRLDDVERLSRHRANLFELAPDLHPVVVGVASRMLELDRRGRAQDLRSVIERLETYRDQPLDLDLERVAGAGSADDRRHSILGVLRDRLFDLSRRNRLIWFRPTQQSLNLTEASVPVLLDVRNIAPEQLFTWPIAAPRVLSKQPISLGSVLRPEDAPYAAGVLDTVIAQARRDRSEYGQSQLRLVVAFLRWHDLKGEVDERIGSPLLLLPATLTRKRGVRDSYVLQAEGTVAEVNPALRQLLRQLYDLELPEVVDLAEQPIEALHADLAAAIHRTEPAVELALRDTPRIELVHRRALVRLQAFQRRASRGSVTLGRRSYSYSYRRRDYRPLGFQVFADRVAHRPAPLGIALGGAPDSRVSAFVEHALPERDTYVIDDGAGGNPYAWELDLCAVTIANFNYRTMSLVRDYRELLETGGTSEAFDRIFTLEPRPLDAPPAELPLDDRYLVVAADGSQVRALARARAGGSLVIQGPPGTGKSQTITNLVADYVARGKRVLFVCQKRAAIDVVHARLRQRGLDELSSLIHDSQADKKAFVQGLRATYEAWLADGRPPEAEEADRAAILAELEAAIEQVGRYEEALSTNAGGDGPTLRTLIERLVELRDARPEAELTAAERRLLPLPGAWWAARPAVAKVTAVLSSGAPGAATGPSPILARSPIAHLTEAILAAPRPDAEAEIAARTAADALAPVVVALESAGRLAGFDSFEPSGLRPADISQAAALGAVVRPLAERGQASALDAGSVAAEALRRHVRDWSSAQAALADRAAAAAGWRQPLARDDARAALAVAQAHETRLFRIFSGAWRRVNGAVKRGYVDPGVAVRTTATDALTRLVAMQDAQAALEDLAHASETVWGDRDPAGLAERIEDIRRSTEPEVVRWRGPLAAAPDGALAATLVEAGRALEASGPALDAVLAGTGDLTLGDVRQHLDALAGPRFGPAIRAAAPALLELDREHHEVARALRAIDAPPESIEFAVADAALREADARDSDLARFDGVRLGEVVARIGELLPRLYAADAAVIVGRVRGRFVEAVAHAARSATAMTPDERDRKKAWTAGRRELENEFRKVMRYRSIRDLASGDTGDVVAALRPIWLMSPTSVSDTLPLDPAAFDLVVYDEASQIPIEEAVPAMHRAHQVVVVGDQMQLPPSQFFAVRSELADDPDDEVQLGVVLDRDSFLAQCAGRLPSTMLTWHYRSRFESLIAFSNTAFYEARLATIPDRRPPPGPLPEIRVEAGGDDLAYSASIRSGVDALLGRPISFHRLERSPYVHRTNPGEAAYIAGLVADLLRRGTGLTLGVVAFSEAQQAEIERALEAIARHDPEFAELYEAELVREDDNQVVGLFVKNLENVQGDERDVIVMSVCYGPDEAGRMIMNFGPINQDGGEKRLNVIFSRARRHMAIVSSIGPDAITNVYNDGANTLRAFLGYAMAVSAGDTVGATSLLRSFGERGRRATDAPADGPVIAQLAAALRERGIEATERLGQSHFRCDLALRRPDDDAYRVAVLIDHRERVGAQPVAERLVSHPVALGAAGWHVAHVLTKDWLDEPGAVLDGLERALDAAGRPAAG